MIDRPLSDVVAKLRGSVGAPVTMTVLRATTGAELTLPMKRSRIVPTTVVYERRDDVALIHLTGFNTATTDNLRAALDKAKADIGADLAGIIIDMRSNRGGLLDQARSRFPKSSFRTARSSRPTDATPTADAPIAAPMADPPPDSSRSSS
jgi:carboxyl-terminal processing protease